MKSLKLQPSHSPKSLPQWGSLSLPLYSLDVPATRSAPFPGRPLFSSGLVTLWHRPLVSDINPSLQEWSSSPFLSTLNCAEMRSSTFSNQGWNSLNKKTGSHWGLLVSSRGPALKPFYLIYSFCLSQQTIFLRNLYSFLHGLYQRIICLLFTISQALCWRIR